MKKLFYTLILLLLGITYTNAQQTYYDVVAGHGNGLRFWSSDSYKIHMGNTAEYHYGPVTEYSIKMNMTSTTGRGWTWGQSGIAPIAALSNLGHMQIAGNFISLGNLGIRTASPRGVFDVASSGDKYLTSSTESVGTAEDLFLPGHIYFTPTTNGNQVFVQARRQSNSGSSKFNFRTYNNGVLNDAALFIDASANVGIGINTPAYKLTVNGVISATEVKVSTTPNSDYVFEPDYNLLPLHEVDAFIQQNKHLPDIPSAEEFQENGVGLGEMDDMLLRKVEEMTLYLLRMQKQMDQLMAENCNLRNEIENLKTTK